METLNVKMILARAKERLQGTNMRQLTVLHTGVTVAAALVITLLQYVLAEGIGNTGGLSGMGTRSVLETVQLVLQWANMILLPFWNLGFLFVALQWARGNRTRREDLLTGFHRVGPCIGLLVNRAILTIAVLVLCINVSSTVYMMSPAASGILQMAEEYGNTEALYEYLYSLNTEQVLELFRGMIPMLVIFVLLGAVILIPLLYRFRMAEYVILEEPRARGLSAMLLSAALLRRRCWQLFKLDLRFWWYYVLKFLCTGLLYADLLLETVGVVLPIGGEAAYFLTYGLYLAGLFAVEVSFRPLVETAYACVYDTWKELGPVQKKVIPVKPQDMPWDTEE